MELTRTIVLPMASEELSPMATKKRTLRQAVEQVRQQQAQESPSPKERIIGALQEASSQNKSPFLTKRLSKRKTSVHKYLWASELTGCW